MDALARRAWSFTGVLATVVALGALFFTVRGLPESLAARDDQGVPGVFTTEREKCERSARTFNKTCSWYGTFVSDDGALVREDVRMDETFERAGQTRPAQVFDDPIFEEKVYARGSDEWVLVIICIGAATARLVGWSYLAFVRRRHLNGPA